MKIDISFDKEFDDLFENKLRKKYSQEMFDIDGIGKQLDFAEFTKKFFDENTKVTADVSVDANANVDDVSVIAYDHEVNKPFKRLNSYYYLWYKIKDMTDKEIADAVIEAQLSGDIYINDFHGVAGSQPYSYYSETVIPMKVHGELLYTSMEKFYNFLKEEYPEVIVDETATQINLTDVQVLDDNNEWVNVSRILKHYQHINMVRITTNNGKHTFVTENHPVMLDNNEEKLASNITFGDKIRESKSELPILGIKSGPYNKEDFDKDILQYSKEAIRDFLNSFPKRMEINGDYVFASPEKAFLFAELFNAVNEEQKALISFVNAYQHFEITIVPIDEYLLLDNSVKKVIFERIPHTAIVWVYDITTDSGHFHCQGLIQHNCFNYSTYDILVQGLPMVNKIKSIPPKYLLSFKNQVEQFTIIAANTTLGATGLADFLVVMSYYVKNLLETKSDAGYTFKSEDDCWRYVKETLTGFIYTINQPMRGNQSCFTNISIYDKYFMEEMNKNYTFPDGSHPDHKILQKLQEVFLDIMNEEMERTPITFPVTTACFSIDENHQIKDKEFLDFIAKQNEKWGFINIYAGASSTLSSCCFSGDQKVLVKGLKNKKPQLVKIKSLKGKNYEIFHNGEWVKGSLVKTNVSNLYQITTEANQQLIVTADHIHSTSEGDKSTKDLVAEKDYLKVNTSILEGTGKLTYEQGYLIGLLARGDYGWHRGYVINVLDRDSDSEIKAIEKANRDFHFSLDIAPITSAGHCAICNTTLFNIIKENWLDNGQLSINCLLETSEFRLGIIDGFVGLNKTIKVKTEKEADTLEAIYTSLGRTVKKYKQENMYIIDDNVEDIIYKNNHKSYVKIIDIFELGIVPAKESTVYCFKMDDEENPYFTLPNGIITHNCRLRSDNNNEYFNSFGSGTSRIGSIGVCTINLPRLAFKNSNNKEKFFEELEKFVEVCSLVNRAKRTIVEERIKSGHHPLYDLGFMQLQKQYLTCGINGFNEAIEILGSDILTEDGQELGMRIVDTINKINDKESKKYKMPYNCEQIPAENVAVKLAEKDKLLGYNDKYDLYSNQFIPLTTKADLLDRIYLQGKFDSEFTGGAIMHCNCETRINQKQQMDLIEACVKSGVVYFAINYNLQECENGHMSVGRKNTCSICGGNIENNYTRPVGKPHKNADYNRNIIY